MKQIILLFAVLVGMMLFVYWSMQPGNELNLASFGFAPPSPATQQKTVQVGDDTFKVEVVDTEETRQIGLSSHSSLEADSGMLFTFEQENVKPEFWMKGMLFPIDIIWINDGVVSQITPQIPIAKTQVPDSQLPRYSPNKTVDYVLEVNSGKAQEKNIKVGDTVKLP